MYTCKQCGQPMAEDQRFCPNCGTAAEPAAPPPSAPRFCPKCGESLEPEAQFCPNCGAPVSAPSTPAVPPTPPHPTIPSAPKAGKKPISIHTIIGVCAVAVVLLVAVVGVRALLKLFQGPGQQFASYQKDFLMEQGVDRLGDLAGAYNDFIHLSTDLTLTAEVDNSDINHYLKDSAIDLGLDLEPTRLLASGKVNLMGSNILSGAVSYEDGVLSFAVPELDENVYTMDVSALAEQYNVSGLDALQIPEIPEDTLVKLGKYYLDIVLGAANKENVTIEDEKEVYLSYFDETLSGKTYVFTPSAEDLEEMFLKLADALEKDKDLRNFVLEVIGENRALVEQLTGLSNLDDDLDDGINNLADQLRDNAEYMAQSLEDTDFTWTMGVSGGRVCLQTIEIENGDTIFAYESMGDEGKDGRQDVLYWEEYGSMVWTFYTDWSKKDGTYSGELIVTTYDEQIFNVTFDEVDLEKKSALMVPYGSYRFTINTLYNGIYEVNLDVEKGEDGGTDHVFTMNGLSDLTYGELDRVEVTLHTTDKDSTASLPKGDKVDITDWDYGQLNDLFYDMGRTFQNEVLDQIPLY